MRVSPPTSHHHTVNHSAGEYVRFFAHANGIESFWALLQRGIFGIYHHVSRKHLMRYVGEFTCRFNRRRMGEAMRVNDLLANVSGKRLTYKALTA